MEEENQLNKLVKQHNERYRSVNFGVSVNFSGFC